jgi:hypothetical protein
MFNLKGPCNQCPFTKGPMNESLRPERIPGLIETFKDHNIFHCHKTIDYSTQFDSDNEDNDFIPNEENQVCAGSILYMEKAGIWNRTIKLAEHFGVYDPTKMHGRELIIDILEGDVTNDETK